MIIPSPIPLDTFEQTIQSDPEVLGVLYFGSLGRGAADRFSDLDIFVWLPDELAISARDKLLQLLGLFGENHWLETGDRHVTGFVGLEWTQVDIEFARREKLVPSARYAGATVVKDTDGVLATVVAACEPERLTETLESAADVIHGAISDLLFLARHNARGSVWSARGNLTYQSTRVYELLGRLRGRRTYGYRYVEELLTPGEQALLTAAWPRELTREENRRAARALWAWIQYVQREAERSIGQPLGVAVDEDDLFAVIDRYYARPHSDGRNGMEQQLKDFAEGHATQNLTIVYSDMHGLWGGVTITLSTSGAYELLERARGQVVPDMVRKTVTPGHVQEVIRLLRETRASEQQALQRTPIPDEVRATLTLRIGDVESSIWELYNNLEKNGRLVRVRRLLLELAKA
jgi:hypothetical protein